MWTFNLFYNSGEEFYFFGLVAGHLQSLPPVIGLASGVPTKRFRMSVIHVADFLSHIYGIAPSSFFDFATAMWDKARPKA